MGNKCFVQLSSTTQLLDQATLCVLCSVFCVPRSKAHFRSALLFYLRHHMDLNNVTHLEKANFTFSSSSRSCTAVQREFETQTVYEVIRSVSIALIDEKNTHFRQQRFPRRRHVTNIISKYFRITFLRLTPNETRLQNDIERLQRIANLLSCRFIAAELIGLWIFVSRRRSEYCYALQETFHVVESFAACIQLPLWNYLKPDQVVVSSYVIYDISRISSLLIIPYLQGRLYLLTTTAGYVDHRIVYCSVFHNDSSQSMYWSSKASTEHRWNARPGKREIPEKTRTAAASSSTIPMCENLRVNPPRIRPCSRQCEASRLTAQLHKIPRLDVLENTLVHKKISWLDSLNSRVPEVSVRQSRKSNAGFSTRNGDSRHLVWEGVGGGYICAAGCWHTLRRGVSFRIEYRAMRLQLQSRGELRTLLLEQSPVKQRSSTHCYYHMELITNVANFAGLTPVSAPVKTYAGRSCGSFSKVDFKKAHITVNSSITESGLVMLEVLAENQFNVGTKRLVVRSQRARSILTGDAQCSRRRREQGNTRLTRDVGGGCKENMKKEVSRDYWEEKRRRRGVQLIAAYVRRDRSISATEIAGPHVSLYLVLLAMFQVTFAEETHEAFSLPRAKRCCFIKLEYDPARYPSQSSITTKSSLPRAKFIHNLTVSSPTSLHTAVDIQLRTVPTCGRGGYARNINDLAGDSCFVTHATHRKTCMILTVDERLARLGIRYVKISTGIKGPEKRKIADKIRRPTVSSVTIPTCENPVIRSGFEPSPPRREASGLTAVPPLPLQNKASTCLQSKAKWLGGNTMDLHSGGIGFVSRANHPELGIQWFPDIPQEENDVIHVSPWCTWSDATEEREREREREKRLRCHTKRDGQLWYRESPANSLQRLDVTAGYKRALWSPMLNVPIYVPTSGLNYRCNFVLSFFPRMWELCRTMPLVGGFSRGSPVSPAPAWIPALLHTSLGASRCFTTDGYVYVRGTGLGSESGRGCISGRPVSGTPAPSSPDTHTHRPLHTQSVRLARWPTFIMDRLPELLQPIPPQRTGDAFLQPTTSCHVSGLKAWERWRHAHQLSHRLYVQSTELARAVLWPTHPGNLPPYQYRSKSAVYVTNYRSTHHQNDVIGQHLPVSSSYDPFTVNTNFYEALRKFYFQDIPPPHADPV
ncbi:hypothetical protein PR048_024207 [Dryococelus australis]|uniref:Uncharacterized protein n=1 Tax=Dryococelus australis TaxID=614101 RepID=A0ABQ9GW96_9NEOP|nr:hypothetical protein PR048_024207 [Dryococelus australis]